LHFTQIFLTDARTFICFTALLRASIDVAGNNLSSSQSSVFQFSDQIFSDRRARPGPTEN
jgi:hypothetical protein